MNLLSIGENFLKIEQGSPKKRGSSTLLYVPAKDEEEEA